MNLSEVQQNIDNGGSTFEAQEVTMIRLATMKEITKENSTTWMEFELIQIE